MVILSLHCYRNIRRSPFRPEKSQNAMISCITGLFAILVISHFSGFETQEAHSEFLIWSLFIYTTDLLPASPYKNCFDVFTKSSVWWSSNERLNRAVSTKSNWLELPVKYSKMCLQIHEMYTVVRFSRSKTTYSESYAERFKNMPVNAVPVECVYECIHCGPQVHGPQGKPPEANKWLQSIYLYYSLVSLSQ